MMNSERTVAIAWLAAAITLASPTLVRTQATQATSACAPANGLNFVCGAQNPEDLVPIPGTRWLIASGMRDGGGLKLVDTTAKTARPFYSGSPAQQRPDKTLFPGCPAAPDVSVFNAHGLYLRRARTAGLYLLYVVSHRPVEAIQVFTVDAQGAEPSLTWTGCVLMPGDNTSRQAAN